MSLIMAKSILTTIVLLVAVGQAISGVRLRGYLKFLPLPIPLRLLRPWHRLIGDTTLVLNVALAVLCVTLFPISLSSLRGLLHSALGTLVILVMLLKVIVARRYRSYLRYMVILGAIVGFSLLGTFITSALWYFWSLL